MLVMLHFNSFPNVILCNQAGVAGHGLMLLDGRALEKCSAAGCWGTAARLCGFWHGDRWGLTLLPAVPWAAQRAGMATELPRKPQGRERAWQWPGGQSCNFASLLCLVHRSWAPPCMLAVCALGRWFCTGAGGGRNAPGKSLTERWWRGMRRKGSGSCLEGGLSNALPCNFKQILLLLWFYDPFTSVSDVDWEGDRFIF